MLVVGGMDFGGMYWLMTSTSAEKSKHNGNIQNPYKENLAFVIEHFYNTTQRFRGAPDPGQCYPYQAFPKKTKSNPA